MFRRAAERPLPKGHVVHGPFPARLRFFGMAFACAFVGTMFTLLALMTEHVECPASGMCTRDGKAMFDRAELRGVHVEQRTGSKGAKYGVVVLDLDGGGRRELTQVDPEQAEEVAARVRGAIASSAPIDETLHGPRYIAPFGIGGMIVGVVLFVLGLSKMGRFDLIIDGPTLKVRRSLYGVPLGTREVSIERVREVLVERGTVATVLRQRYEKEIEAARLHLVYESGDDVPLTRGLFPGHALHLHAASALRSALGLEPNARDDDELARIPMRKWDTGTRFAFAWIGVTTGALLGLLVLGLSLIALGLTSAHANIEGWMLASGAGGGAIGGVALVFHWTRTRLPR
jgi:hypothetical protein